MVANVDNSDRKSEQPGRTYTNFLPTSVGIVAECTQKSVFLNPLAFQAGSHAHRIPFRSSTTFNHRLEESNGTRPKFDLVHPKFDLVHPEFDLVHRILQLVVLPRLLVHNMLLHSRRMLHLIVEEKEEMHIIGCMLALLQNIL